MKNLNWRKLLKRIVDDIRYWKDVLQEEELPEYICVHKGTGERIAFDHHEQNPSLDRMRKSGRWIIYKRDNN